MDRRRTRKFDKRCLEVSKLMTLMIRLLRHDDSIHREEDLASIFRSKNEFTSQWPIQTWISFLRKGGGPKRRFQYCLNLASPEHFLYIRAIEGHSGGALHLNIFCTFEQLKVTQKAPLVIPHCKTTYCCQTTPSSTSVALGTLTTCTPSLSRG